MDFKGKGVPSSVREHARECLMWEKMKRSDNFDKAAFQSDGTAGFFLKSDATKLNSQEVKAACQGVIPQFRIGIIDKPLVSMFIFL